MKITEIPCIYDRKETPGNRLEANIITSVPTYPSKQAGRTKLTIPVLLFDQRDFDNTR